MPLNVVPVSGIQAHYTRADWSNVVDDYQHHCVWIGHMDAPSDFLGSLAWETRGSIRTSRSLIKGHHNCDNLQLEGEITDLTWLTGWGHASNSIFGDGNPILAFPYNGKLTPVSHYFEWGKPDSVKLFNPVVKVDCYLYCYSNLENEYFTLCWPMTGGQFPQGRSFVFPFYKLLTYPSGYTYMKQSAIVYHMYGVCGYDYNTLYNKVIPAIVAAIDAMNWDQPGLYWVRQPDTYIDKASESYSLDYLYRDKAQEWTTAFNAFSRIDYDFGELHYRAISKISTIDVNGLAYMKDIKNFISEIRDLVKLLGGKVSPKTISQAYLAYEYGARLTIADTQEYIEGMSKVPQSGVSATEEWFSPLGAVVKSCSTVRYKYRDTLWDKIYEFFHYLDICISPENLWDLIPYSFVVDWFFNVNDILSRIDTLDMCTHLNIDAVFDSYTAIGDVQASRIMDGMVGTVSYRRYARRCHLDATFPLIVPSKPSASSHWLEGTALIIQRLFK